MLPDLATAGQLAVSGLTIGCVYSLVGLGFALTLRATELINFAQGEMVMLGAFIGLSVLTLTGLPYAVAFLVALVVTGLVGVGIERLVLRRILRRRSPLLNLLIATLGLSIGIQAVSVLVWGREPIAYPRIFDETPVQLWGLRVRSLNLWILGLSLSVMAALQFFFRRTLTGIAWRAASLDPATASLYGVSHNRTVSLTFGISAALGGGAGVLIAPLFFASTGLGLAVIVKSFAAAALGGYGVVGTMLGGLGLGVIETFTAGVVSSAYKNVITYGLLIGVLMAAYRPRLPAGRSITEGPRVAGTGASLIGGRRSRVAVGVVLLAVWLAVGLGGDTYALRVVNMALIAGVAVLGLQVIVGLTGQFSFGHAAFYGVGAYTSALVTTKLGLGFIVAVPLAGVVAALAGLVVAPILRLSGHFLAMATLAMGEIVFLLIVNLKWLTNGAYGIYSIPAPGLLGYEIESEQAYFVLISGALLLVYAALWRLVHSRFGRSLVAIRENELAAIACGVPTGRQKVKAFMIGSACAGVAGSLYAHYLAYINPDSFTFGTSVQFLTMVVIGGLGSLPGGIVGALVVTLLPEYLRGLAEYRLLVYGALIVSFMMYLPGGVVEIAGLVAGRFRVAGAAGLVPRGR